MTVVVTCRVGRRIAWTAQARRSCRAGVGAPAMATKVCRFERQSSVPGVRPSTAWGLGRGGQENERLRQIGRTACLGAEVLRGVRSRQLAGGARRVALTSHHLRTPLTTSLLATNEHIGTSHDGSAR
jgi:hypothetical protein